MCGSSKSDAKKIIFEYRSADSKENSNIHKLHFTIKRGKSDDKQNLLPAILKCIGKGLTLNEKVTIKKSHRRILQQGDMIKITEVEKSFIFIDLRSRDQNFYSTQVTDQYYIGPVLGSGVNGAVCLAYGLNTQRKFAIKTYRKTSLSFNREVEVIREIKHLNLLKLIKVIETPLHNYLITEHMCAGDLLMQIKYSAKRSLSEYDTKFAIYQIARGLNYLHEKNFAHLDIKLENVFITVKNGEFIYKIGDFGFSSTSDDISFKCGSVRYISPEIFQLEPEKSYSGKKSDMWSLGVVVFICLSGTFPFHKGENIKAQIIAVYYQFDDIIWKEISDDAKNVIKHLLQLNPNNRLTANELTSQPWFNDSFLTTRLSKLYKIPIRENQVALEGRSKRQRIG